MSKLRNIFNAILFMPRWVLLIPIFIYQKTFSPDHGFLIKPFFPHGYCKFHPSCSQYGFETIKNRGLIRGVPKTIWRILRCNPWNQGGIDKP